MNRLFAAKEIEKIIGIGSDKLLYWVRRGLVTPEKIARGRGGKNYFSIDQLFYLSLIKKLESYGIELNFVKDIIEAENVIKELDDLGLGKWTEEAKKRRDKVEEVWKRDILKVYRANKEEYKKGGVFLLMIYKEKGLFKKRFNHQMFILDILRRAYNKEIKLDLDEVLLIDIGMIIKDLEARTGVEV